MSNQLPHTDASTTVDLTGLPEAVVRQVTHLVEEARQKQSRAATPVGEPPPLLGRFARLGIRLPKDELDQDQREAWAGFPGDVTETTYRW